MGGRGLCAKPERFGSRKRRYEKVSSRIPSPLLPEIVAKTLDFAFQLAGVPQEAGVAKSAECARDHWAARGERHGMVYLVKKSK